MKKATYLVLSIVFMYSGVFAQEQVKEAGKTGHTNTNKFKIPPKTNNTRHQHQRLYNGNITIRKDTNMKYTIAHKTNHTKWYQYKYKEQMQIQQQTQ